MGKFDRCYLCNDIDLGDGKPSIRLLGTDMVCTNCVLELPSPERDTKAEGEVDILDYDPYENDPCVNDFYNSPVDKGWDDDEL